MPIFCFQLLPLSFVDWQDTVDLAARLVLTVNLSLDDKLLSDRPDKQHILLEKPAKSDKT